MNETGAETQDQTVVKEKRLEEHYKIATNPKVNANVREASAEAIHYLRRDLGEGFFRGFLRRVMFTKKSQEPSVSQPVNQKPTTK